ncbi:MAG TPA: acyl carrier protein, partial [Burkholderiaceae bacterium]|nr:acyl carrier protein [Burkholderiaceae bacterium]
MQIRAVGDHPGLLVFPENVEEAMFVKLTLAVVILPASRLAPVGVAWVRRLREVPLDTDEIRAIVRATMEATAPGADWRDIAPDQPLREQVDFDSLDWLNFVAGLAERLTIRIPASEYEKLVSVDAIVAYLAAAQARAAAGAASPAAPTAGALPYQQYLIGGIAVTVRPIHREDRELEADFVRHLSTEARYKRFMVTLRELPEGKLRYLTEVDQIDHVAIVAVAQRDGR